MIGIWYLHKRNLEVGASPGPNGSNRSRPLASCVLALDAKFEYSGFANQTLCVLATSERREKRERDASCGTFSSPQPSALSGSWRTTEAMARAAHGWLTRIGPSLRGEF